MTDELDKLAGEIVKAQHLGVGKVSLVRLGLEAGEERGMKLQRERDAGVADNYEPQHEANTALSRAIAGNIAKAIRTQP